MTFLAIRRLFLWALALLLASYLGFLIWVDRGMAAIPFVDQPVSRESSWTAARFSDANPWARPALETIASEVESYRLSGTFQSFVVNDSEQQATEQTSLALVDDLRTGKQHMVRVGDSLGPFEISEIGEDRLRLSNATQTWTLVLSGQIALGGTPNPSRSPESQSQRFDKVPALEVTPYGKRIAENQWVISREAIKGYAEEIMANPLRATQLYRSFSQVAGEEESEESGFRVQMKGERDFFTQMGLEEQDVIRKVNSMRMKNQNRAEYLVGEFMQDRMGLVVLDIERNGVEQKLIYIIRE